LSGRKKKLRPRKPQRPKTSQKLLLPDEFKDVGVDTAASAENKAQTHSVFQVNVGIAMHF
jgi:hypothetical protein